MLTEHKFGRNDIVVPLSHAKTVFVCIVCKSGVSNFQGFTALPSRVVPPVLTLLSPSPVSSTDQTLFNQT